MFLSPILMTMAVAQMSWRGGTFPPQVSRKPDVALHVGLSRDLREPKGRDGKKDEAKAAAYQKVAAAMNRARIAPNNDRKIYFQHHPRPDRIEGWLGMIEKVVQSKKGDLIATVRVQALLDGSRDNFYFVEKYSVSDAEVKYLGCGIHAMADQPYSSAGK